MMSWRSKNSTWQLCSRSSATHYHNNPRCSSPCVYNGGIHGDDCSSTTVLSVMTDTRTYDINTTLEQVSRQRRNFYDKTVCWTDHHYKMPQVEHGHQMSEKRAMWQEAHSSRQPDMMLIEFPSNTTWTKPRNTTCPQKEEGFLVPLKFWQWGTAFVRAFCKRSWFSSDEILRLALCVCVVRVVRENRGAFQNKAPTKQACLMRTMQHGQSLMRYGQTQNANNSTQNGYIWI